jgi:hypothetical protein
MNKSILSNISKELALILYILSYKLDLSTKEELATFADNEKINWDRFIQLIRLHRLNTICFLTLNECEIKIPTQELEKIKLNFEKERKRNFIINSSLIQVNQALEENNLQALWIKGPAQSQRMYNNPILRSYSDIDLYIDLKDLHKIDSILRKLDYYPTEEWKNYPKSHFSKFVEIKKEFSYVHAKKRVCIDLHWNIVLSNKLLPLKFEELYQKAITLDFYSSKLKTLSNEDNFVYLNIHGTFDTWKQLSQLFDISYSIKETPSLINRFDRYLIDNQLSEKLKEGILLSDFFFKKETNYSKGHNFLTKYEFYSETLESRIQKFKRIGSFHPSLKYKIECFEYLFFYAFLNKQIKLPKALFYLYYLHIPFTFINMIFRRVKN